MPRMPRFSKSASQSSSPLWFPHYRAQFRSDLTRSPWFGQRETQSQILLLILLLLLLCPGEQEQEQEQEGGNGVRDG